MTTGLHEPLVLPKSNIFLHFFMLPLSVSYCCPVSSFFNPLAPTSSSWLPLGNLSLMITEKNGKKRKWFIPFTNLLIFSLPSLCHYGWIAHLCLRTTLHLVILAVIHSTTTLQQYVPFPSCVIKFSTLLSLLQLYKYDAILVKTNKSFDHTYPSRYHTISVNFKFIRRFVYFHYL